MCCARTAVLQGVTEVSCKCFQQFAAAIRAGFSKLFGTQCVTTAQFDGFDKHFGASEKHCGCFDQHFCGFDKHSAGFS